MYEDSMVKCDECGDCIENAEQVYCEDCYRKIHLNRLSKEIKELRTDVNKLVKKVDEIKPPDKGTVFCNDCFQEAKAKIKDLEAEVDKLKTELDLVITIGEKLKEEINGIQRL